MADTLAHVGVRATDLEETLRFWRDLLGLRVVEETENRYDLTDGVHNFRVFEYEGDGRPPHVGGMDDYLHVGVVVPDARAALERFEDAGVPIVGDGLAGEPYDPDDPPETAFKVEDPDGIVVDVTEARDQWPGVALP